MSSNQPQQSSLPLQPDYLNTGSPDSGPLAPAGGDTEDRPDTDESGSLFPPSSSPFAIRHRQTLPTDPTAQVSGSANPATVSATPLAPTQQSDSTASSSRQRRSDAPSPSDHSTSSAAEVVIFEDPASPRSNEDSVAAPRQDDSSHLDMESPDPARAPLAPIVPGNARSVNVPNPPLERDPDFLTIHTSNRDGKRVPSKEDILNFFEGFEED
ncbi:hypothetical protein PG985_012701 [Apiospora marii]|uniref:uncharacterized protein n=1 Tax=Apiospora marii TaxID=335849 RepID=UPI00312F7AC7